MRDNPLVGVLQTADDRSPVRLLDVDREGVRPGPGLAAKVWNPAASDDGIVLSSADPENPDADHNTALDAYDALDGHRAWRLRAPSGSRLGSARIADGRVYVVRHPIHTDADRGRRVRRVRGELLVLDADTGRLLHTLRLPSTTVPESGDSAILDVGDATDGTDGTVTVRWRDEGPDLLIITD
ncbi:MULTISPECIES: hypothetical protein [unclassified Streptomyces]|uniref:hypothetical protein n=1 Tax=unclassified Streptomyces TaxID=2593676 RepID=UPI00365CDFF2